MLKILNLEAGYGNLRVLKGVSLHVNAGEIVTLIGANGAGKTTLLKTIAAVVRAQNGEIVFNDRYITLDKTEKIVKAGCALVPEGRQVFRTLTVSENLLLGGYLRYAGAGKKRLAATREYIYSLFPVLRERSTQFAGTLSGGEQQMLAIGRALMSQPLFLMMDEPSMGIAPIIVKEIFHNIKKLQQTGLTILLVEQNAKMALNIADRGYVIETGQIVLEGTAAELARNNEVQRAYLGKDYTTVDE